jgi:hypothetical protein
MTTPSASASPSSSAAAAASPTPGGNGGAGGGSDAEAIAFYVLARVAIVVLLLLAVCCALGRQRSTPWLLRMLRREEAERAAAEGYVPPVPAGAASSAPTRSLPDALLALANTLRNPHCQICETTGACPVCLEEQTTVLPLRCGHTVCRGCVVQLVSAGVARCPMCRADLAIEVLESAQDEAANVPATAVAVAGSSPEAAAAIAGGSSSSETAREREGAADHLPPNLTGSTTEAQEAGGEQGHR